MNRLRILQTAGTLTAAILLAACTQDGLTEGTAQDLPDGMYPVILSATGLEISAATRATADGTWNQGDEVAIQIGSDVKKYTANSSGTSTMLSAADGVTPFYWQKTNEVKNVSAWYLGTGYNATLPTTWDVQTNQNSNNGYQKSDFLYAPPTVIDFSGPKSLTFYHQTAKVVVNIRKYGVASDANKISSVTIRAIKEGTFITPLTNNYGLSPKSTETPWGITPFKLSNPNTNVVFENEKSGETALASYQALVIPQTLSSSNVIEINIDGYNTFKYTPTGSSWAGGTQYTYNLTIDGKKVTATVTTDDIRWTNGSSGSGSVEIE